MTHPSEYIQTLSKKGTAVDPFLQEHVHFRFFTPDHAQSAHFGYMLITDPIFKFFK